MYIYQLVTGTLRRQLSLFLILLVVVAVSAIGIASIQIAQQVIKDRTIQFGDKMLTQAAFRLGSLIDNAETTVDSLILDRRLAPLLQDLASPEQSVHEKARNDLHVLLAQYKASLVPGIELILTDSTQNNIVSTYQRPPIKEELLPRVFPTKNKMWRLRYLPDYNNDNPPTVGRLLELTARIISLPGQSQKGWIILHLDYRVLESIMTNISLLEGTLNRFQSEAVVFGPDQQIIFPWVVGSDPLLEQAYQKISGQFRNTKSIEEKFDGDKHLIIATPVPWTPWEMYISAPTKQLYLGLEQIYHRIWTIGIICALISVLLATVISFFVTKPLHKLRKTMSLVEEGNFKVRAPEGGPSEIQTLARAFNRMLFEVDALTQRLVAEESKRKTAVIKALQAQISPHFLYNTLSAMAGMTAKRPPEELAEALRSLKRLFYLGIGKNNDFVSLADEFEYIQHYLYLMDIRYPGKYLLQMDLPEELRSCQIIRLVLQPIVENSLQHGFKAGGGLIQVSAQQEGKDLIIRIADNGVGLSEEQVRTVMQNKGSKSGIGLYNVNERIRLCFGSSYGLTLESTEGMGTTVSLRIPLQYSNEDKRGGGVINLS
mgnify:CR=1 FL=1